MTIKYKEALWEFHFYSGKVSVCSYAGDEIADAIHDSGFKKQYGRWVALWLEPEQ